MKSMRNQIENQMIPVSTMIIENVKHCSLISFLIKGCTPKRLSWPKLSTSHCAQIMLQGFFGSHRLEKTPAFMTIFDDSLFYMRCLFPVNIRDE